jgi:hypothetical protein
VAVIHVHASATLTSTSLLCRQPTNHTHERERAAASDVRSPRAATGWKEEKTKIETNTRAGSDVLAHLCKESIGDRPKKKKKKKIATPFSSLGWPRCCLLEELPKGT